MMPPASNEAASLELRILNFEVPVDWALSTVLGTNPHDKLQELLKQEGLWGEGFRYGCADSTFTADRELREKGVSESQLKLPDGTVELHSANDSRDFYCNEGFFTGRRQVVIYDARKLKSKNPQCYTVSQPSALVAVVRPVMQP